VLSQFRTEHGPAISTNPRDAHDVDGIRMQNARCKTGRIVQCANEK
jgi:hypothetical protein